MNLSSVPSFVGDMVAERVEQRVQKSHEGSGLQPLADLGEASHVDEHHRQFAIVAAEAERVWRVLDAMQQRWRQILAEGLPDLAALPVGHQKAERRCREMRDRRRNDWSQRVKEKPRIGESEP